MTPAPIGHNNPPSEEDDALNRDGWIAVARTMRSHWLVGFGKMVEPCDPELDFVYSRGEAWLDLIMECRYFAGTVNNNGRKMRLEPGQLVGATSWLAARWNWTPKQVRTFLDKLEEEDMITRNLPGTHPCSEENQTGAQVGRGKGGSKGRFASVLSVSKYAIYQLAHREPGQVEGTADGRLRAGSGQVEGGLRAGSGQVESKSPIEINDLQAPNKGTREQGNKTPPPTPASPLAAKPTVDEPLAGEERVGASVFVNCETVRHRSFTLSIPGITMQLVLANLGLSKVDAEKIAKDAAIAHALQWAAEIDAGKHARDVVPSNPANFIRGSIVAQRNKQGARTPQPNRRPRY